MVITSLDNKKIKMYASLKNSKNRSIEKLFLVEGMHLVEEAYAKNKLVDILLLENTNLTFSCNIDPVMVTDSILKKVSSLTNYSKVIGVCRIDEKEEIVGDKILMLDNIQDPGNLGTIIRSACAFNVDTIVLSDETVDLYNEKVIRSTQGMLFNINIVHANLEDAIINLKKKGLTILGTDVINGMDVHNEKISKYVLIMGNEGHGIRPSIKALCDSNLYIKMNDDCESLNVGVATSILLYELNRGYDE